MSQNKYLVVLCSALETFLCCGILFGWPNLVKIFKEENFFECKVFGTNITDTEGELPSTENNECHQMQKLVQAYQYACVIFAALGVVVGIIFDKFGTTATRMTGLVLFLSGNIVMITAGDGNHSLLYPGLCLIAGSGIFFLTCQMQTANLFVSSHGRVLTMLNGAMDTSSSASLILLAVYRAFGYKLCFTLYAGLAIFILIRTLFLLPTTQIPYPLPENYKMDPPSSNMPGKGQNCFSSFSKTNPKLDCDDKQIEDNKLLEDKKSNASSCIDVPSFFSREVFFSPLYLTTVLFFVINVFRIYMFLASSSASTAEIIAASNNNITDQEAQGMADSMVTKFGVVQGMGVLIAPVNGFIIDKMMMRTNEKFKSLSVSVICCIGLGITFSILCIVPLVEVQYMAFFISVVHRAFTYSVNAAVIAMCFPNIYFGKLYGFSQFATLVSGQLVGTMFSWGASHGFKKMNLALLVLEASTVFHFLTLLFFAKKPKPDSPPRPELK